MDVDLCEECGEWKPCIIRIKENNIYKRITRRIYVKCIAIFAENEMGLSH